MTDKYNLKDSNNITKLNINTGSRQNGKSYLPITNTLSRGVTMDQYKEWWKYGVNKLHPTEETEDKGKIVRGNINPGPHSLPITNKEYCDTRMMCEENGRKPKLDNEYCYYHQKMYLNVHVKKSIFKCECGLFLCDECEECWEHRGHLKIKINK